MTIKKIAEIAKVSQATVSLALNNRQGVSEETRQMIINIANENGYNKKLNGQKRNILFIKYIGSGAAIEQNGDFIARIMDAVEQNASNLGYNLVIKNIQACEFKVEIKAVKFEEYIGVIFLGTEADMEDLEALQEVTKDLTLPIVAVDNMFEKADIDAVVMDNCGGVNKAVAYLVSEGHTHIGYIDSTVRFSNFNHRTDAYHKSIKEYGLEPNQTILYVAPSLEGAYIDAIRQLKTNKYNMPTAFVAANDTIAIGAIKAFKECGLEIPKDISIIGFDDIPFCTVLDKTLTTIRVYKERIGALAVGILDDKINNYSEETVKTLVTTKLIERESTRSII